MDNKYNHQENREKIFMFSFDYLPNHGGIARMCDEVIRGLKQQGVDCEILTTKLYKDSHREGIVVNKVSQRRPFAELQAFFKLFFSLKNHILVCSRWYPEGLLCFLAGIKKTIILAHGAEILPSTGRFSTLMNYLKLKTLNRVSLVISNSKFTSELVVKNAPLANSVALPLAVNVKEFFPVYDNNFREKHGLNEKFVISTVSRIEAHKGHITVLKALSSLSNKYRDKVVYLIGGTGGHTAILKKQVAQKGLNKQVKFIGFIEEKELKELYSATDLFALCSQSLIDSRKIEGFGLALLEAQACGTPVVGADSGGIPSALDTQAGGYLIPEEDDQSLCNIIVDLMDNPEKKKMMGKKAYERATQYCTWEQYSIIFLQLLHNQFTKA